MSSLADFIFVHNGSLNVSVAVPSGCAAKLCSYGARGSLCLERLSALPDGRLPYRMKRPSHSGERHLVLSPLACLRRLAALSIDNSLPPAA